MNLWGDVIFSLQIFSSFNCYPFISRFFIVCIVRIVKKNDDNHCYYAFFSVLFLYNGEGMCKNERGIVR